MANKTGRMSPGPDSRSLLLQMDTPSNNSFLWVTESHTPVPALDPRACGKIGKGFEIKKLGLMLRGNLKSKQS